MSRPKPLFELVQKDADGTMRPFLWVNRRAGGLYWGSYIQTAHEKAQRPFEQVVLHPPQGPFKRAVAKIYSGGGDPGHHLRVEGWPQSPSITFERVWMGNVLRLAPPELPRGHFYAVVRVSEEEQLHFSVIPLPVGVDPKGCYPEGLVYGSILLRTVHRPDTAIVIRQPFEMHGPAVQVDERTWHATKTLRLARSAPM